MRSVVRPPAGATASGTSRRTRWYWFHSVSAGCGASTMLAVGGYRALEAAWKSPRHDR